MVKKKVLLLNKIKKYWGEILLLLGIALALYFILRGAGYFG